MNIDQLYQQQLLGNDSLSHLEVIEDLPVVEVGVGEYAVDTPTDAAQLCDGGFLDGDAAGEVLVAVEEAGGAVERVARVVDGGALLGRLVGGAQEDPLLGRRHLGARLGLALPLQHHRQPVQLHAELPQVLVLPDALVLREQKARRTVLCFKSSSE